MVETENTTFQNPVKINAGRKALAHIPIELAAMGAERPLLITTKALLKKRAVPKVVDGLMDSGVSLGVYDGVGEHARLETVLDLALLFEDGGFDAIMTLGSGPVTHTAKALNVAVTEKTRELAPFAANGNGKIGRLKPYIAIPAKWGDGYETTSTALVEDLTFSSLMLMPDLVIVDPEIFVPETPLAAISGAMAALTHAVEGIIGPVQNPFADAYGCTAIRMIMVHFTESLHGKGGWEDARCTVAAADTMAASVFSNVGPGLTHRLAQTITSKNSCPLGLCMGILIPYVLDHLSTRDDFFPNSLLLSMAGSETYAITASELRVGKALTLMQEFQFALYEATKRELPMTLEDVGIETDQLKPMVASMADEAPDGVNEEALLMILERALKGDPIDI